MIAATIGSIFVERKKKRTSVHFSTGLIDSAYAAGSARTMHRNVLTTLAVIELSSGGHGPASRKVW